MKFRNADCRVKVLLLAAGSALRFGEDKRQIEVTPGQSLLQLSLAPILEMQMEIVIALSNRSSDNALSASLRGAGLRCICCDRAHEGMGATVAQAIGQIENADAVFVALGDMPLIDRSTWRALVQNADSEAIVFPQFDGRRGHPVLFGSRFFPELARLEGDRGGAQLLEKNASSCRVIPVDDPGILFDVDTPDKLRELRVALKNRGKGPRL